MSQRVWVMCKTEFMKNVPIFSLVLARQFLSHVSDRSIYHHDMWITLKIFMFILVWGYH